MHSMQFIYKVAARSSVEQKMQKAFLRHTTIQKKPLLKHDLTFAKPRTICKHSGDVSEAPTKRSIVHFQKTRESTQSESEHTC